MFSTKFLFGNNMHKLISLFPLYGRSSPVKWKHSKSEIITRILENYELLTALVKNLNFEIS